mmetsp:Transcript_103867/g.126941  ORF Transcript_103867/g.126941 Transcript_103867/m.126941 type:complete len:322 (+) Transcript_103867:117-1082(+)
MVKKKSQSKAFDSTPKCNKNAVFAVIFYWVTSLSLVFLNKIVMVGDFTHMDAPLFMSWTQFVITVLCCYIIGETGKYIKIFSFFPPFEYKLNIAKKVMPLTFVFLGMIVFNNLCLKYVEVSFYQVARSLTIVFNIVFSFLFLGRKQSLWVIVVCGVICFGYYLGCEGEIHFSIQGVIFGVLSSAFVALYAIFVKRTLPAIDDNSEKLMIYNNINAIILLPIFIILFTSEPIEINMSSFVFYTQTFWGITLVAGIFGFLINFASYIQIKYTSPLGHNVSGTAKGAFQTIVALYVFQNPWTYQGIFGQAFILIFSFVYSRVKK